jgi:hypothetical protein
VSPNCVKLGVTGQCSGRTGPGPVLAGSHRARSRRPRKTDAWSSEAARSVSAASRSAPANRPSRRAPIRGELRQASRSRPQPEKQGVACSEGSHREKADDSSPTPTRRSRPAQFCTTTAARGVITSMLARTSAGMGRAADYNRFHGWAVESIEKYVEDAAAGHYHLAEAARACHAWRDSEVHATKAWELAIRSDDRMITRLAEQLLAQAKARENDAPPAPPPASTADLNRLLSVRLQRWSPEEHRGPQRTAFRNQWVA